MLQSFWFGPQTFTINTMNGSERTETQEPLHFDTGQLSSQNTESDMTLDGFVSDIFGF